MATRQKSTPHAGAPAPTPDIVRIRMYRHGLGDCFLLRFAKDGHAGETFNVLIDCGLIMVAQSPREKMAAVLADLAQVTGSRLDVVVLTHEHWDHVSGFSTLQAQALFDNFTIGEAWYAWTEDARNKLGMKLREERAAKSEALRKAALALDVAARDQKLQGVDKAEATRRAEHLASVLRFFGVDGLSEVVQAAPADAKERPTINKTRSAFDYLRGRSDVQKRFLHPNNDPIPLPGVSGVRVFVLGPPEDERMIKRSKPSKVKREVYEFAGDLAMDLNLSAAFDRLATGGNDDDVDDGPFDLSLRLRPQRGLSSPALDALMQETWSDADMAWRRIDLDWTAQAESLALDLDNHTNNTCLVLAFELSPGGKVLLFPADAQVGNWLSWQTVQWTLRDLEGQREVTGPQLLGRTVFYKVGHHGSHNATLRELGLEQMGSKDLTAFVPVFRAEASKAGWDEMPFNPLVTRLQERTDGRLVFSDADLPPPSGSELANLSPSRRNEFDKHLTKNALFYEYSIAL